MSDEKTEGRKITPRELADMLRTLPDDALDDLSLVFMGGGSAEPKAPGCSVGSAAIFFHLTEVIPNGQPSIIEKLTEYEHQPCRKISRSWNG